MLGTRIPRKPDAMSTGVRRRGENDAPTSPVMGGRSYGRPGEPVNKVFVQYSNDLEGFLPYTLVISEDHGLEFFSLSGHPDFVIDPLNVLSSNVVDYEMLMKDAFFSNLSRSILERSDLKEQALELSAASKPTPSQRPHQFEERVQPPYKPMVQLSIRRTALEGGQVIVFIAVQTDVLASELVRGIKQLRRRRAVLQSAGGSKNKGEGGGTGGTADGAEDVTTRSFSVASRGCPSPRTVASHSLASTARTTGRGST